MQSKDCDTLSELPPHDNLYSVAQAAKRLAVSKATIWRLIQQKSLDAHRVGPTRRLIRIAESAIQRYLEG